MYTNTELSTGERFLVAALYSNDVIKMHWFRNSEISNQWAVKKNQSVDVQFVAETVVSVCVAIQFWQKQNSSLFSFEPSRPWKRLWVCCICFLNSHDDGVANEEKNENKTWKQHRISSYYMVVMDANIFYLSVKWCCANKWAKFFFIFWFCVLFRYVVCKSLGTVLKMSAWNCFFWA